MSELLEAALLYVPRTVPLRPNGKEPVPVGWPTWQAARETVEAWWRSHPQANVGVRTGQGLAVLDVDPRHGGTEGLAQLEAQHGALPADAPEVVTGSGGRHIYFTAPRDLPSFDLAPGVEVKAAGCQVVAPPSVHPSGRLYVWHPARPFQRRPPTLPAWIAGRSPVVVEREVSDQARERRAADPLLAIPAAVYVPALTGRTVDARGMACCPFHKNGRERRPALRVYDTRWACHACPPRPGAGLGSKRQRCLGGDLYTLAALLGDYRLPLRGSDFPRLRERLDHHLGSLVP